MEVKTELENHQLKFMNEYNNIHTWLKSLSVGDDVAIEHRNYISHNKTCYTTDKIQSITEIFIKTVNFPYEFEYGIVIHDVWDSQTHILTPITQEILDSIEKQCLLTYSTR